MQFDQFLTVLSDIENWILARLESKNLAVGQFSIGELDEVVETIKTPAVGTTFSGAQFARVTDVAYKVSPAQFSVYIVIQNLKSAKDRRVSIYQNVLGAVVYISGKKPTKSENGIETELHVAPLKPVRIRKLYESKTRISYAIDFTTSFSFAQPYDDENTDALLSAALQLFSKPGDDVEDAGAIVDLSGEDNE
jgi:hypothetical protein